MARSSTRAGTTSALLLATWNVRHGRPRRGFASNRKLSAALASLAADVVSLQEVDRRVVRSGFADQAQLAARDDLTVHYAPAGRLLATGSDGVALCVRGTIDAVEEHRWRRRVAVLARAGNVSIATTHLEADAAVARRQLDELLSIFAGWPRPRVLLGDLNLSTDDVRAPLRAAGLAVVDGGSTEPAWAPHQRIDHVAVDGLAIGSERTVELAVSDHRAVLVEVER